MNSIQQGLVFLTNVDYSSSRLFGIFYFAAVGRCISYLRARQIWNFSVTNFFADAFPFALAGQVHILGFRPDLSFPRSLCQISSVYLETKAQMPSESPEYVNLARLFPCRTRIMWQVCHAMEQISHLATGQKFEQLAKLSTATRRQVARACLQCLVAVSS